MTGTALRRSRSVHSVAGGVEAIEEWVRSVGVPSPGAKAGAGQRVWPGGSGVREVRTSAAPSSRRAARAVLSALGVRLARA